MDWGSAAVGGDLTSPSERRSRDVGCQKEDRPGTKRKRRSRRDVAAAFAAAAAAIKRRVRQRQIDEVDSRTPVTGVIEPPRFRRRRDVSEEMQPQTLAADFPQPPIGVGNPITGVIEPPRFRRQRDASEEKQRQTLAADFPDPPIGVPNPMAVIKSEEEKQPERWIVDPEEDSSDSADISMYERPLPHHCPPFPTGGNGKDVEKWIQESWEISQLAAEDPINCPTIFNKLKDLHTNNVITNSRDKHVIMRGARSIVSIMSSAPDGTEQLHCTGVIIGGFNANERARILTSSNTVCDFEGKPADRQLLVRLPNNESCEGHILFFDHYYGIALLGISAGISLQGPSFAIPGYGDEVFILSRDEEWSLMAKSGRILYFEEPILDRNCYMYLSCGLPKGGTGGPVMDKYGHVTAMSLGLGSKHPAILGIPIIFKCIAMQRTFSRIARPIHGLSLTTIEMMSVTIKEMLSRDFNINSGYLVNMVSTNSTAERFGIRRGDVITSFDGMSFLSLPKLEEYLLSLGKELLDRRIHSSSKVVVKVQVYDPQACHARCINLPIGFLPIGFSSSPAGV